MATPAEVIEEAVRRIVDEVHPIRIVVFGSTVRRGTGPDSDLDLLVVMPDGANRRDTAYRLHRRLRGLGCPKDIVVALAGEVDKLRENPSMIVHTALTEGREVYHAA